MTHPDQLRAAVSLRELRERLGLSLRDVEAITEGVVSNAYLSQLETGKVKNPSVVMASALAAAYFIPVGEIIEIIHGGVAIRSVPTCPMCGQSMFNAEGYPRG